MLHLLIVSCLWGLSFGLVKARFPELGGATLAMLRLLIALPCFLPLLARPFLRLDRTTITLAAIGAVQYGLMYVCLFSAFSWLSGHEVALLTIFTPLYVVLAEALAGRRMPPAWFWMTALLAVAGALWIFRPEALPGKAAGILLMQGANLCFAAGQVAYRRMRLALPPMRDADCYAWLYLGGVLATLPFALPQNPVAAASQLSGQQWLALVYLGAVASGLGFFLWNAGAVKVNPATLAVFNNLKIPIATVIAIALFGEQAELDRLVPGLLVMLAALVWAEVAARPPTRRS